MSGAGSLRCPECGGETRLRRRLRRTRRRWRWAVVGAVLLVGAYPLYLAPIVRRDGWLGAAPRWAVILMVPLTPNHRRDPVYLQIIDRLFQSEWELVDLHDWERWLLDGSSRRALAGDGAPRLLGARLQVLMHADAAERAPPDRRGPVVLLAAQRAYATCRTYRDRATISTADGAARSLAAFERGLGFRWEAERSGPASGPRHVVVWANEDVARSWDDVHGVSWRPSRESAVTAGSSHAWTGPPAVMMLVAPWSREVIDSMAGAAWLGSSEIGGHPCDRISGVDRRGVPVELWIDSRTRLIRSMRRGGALPVQADYEPEVEIEIDPAWLDFNPSDAASTPLRSE